jgi:hypothetical protein
MKLSKIQKPIYDWILSNPGYLKTSPKVVAKYYPKKVDVKHIVVALEQARIKCKQSNIKPVISLQQQLDIRNGVNVEELSNNLYKTKIENTKKSILKLNRNSYDKDNVLFLPDLHSPFIKPGVLEFCLEQQDKYKCGTVIFAGDIIDGHAWSYHEKDVDGMSVGHELSAAKIQLEEWFRAFPKAISLMGNHDLLIQRKAKTIGLSKHFIKGFGDVLDAPKTWEFKLEHTFHNVLYKHGSVGDAFTVAKKSRISTCQGHFHSKTFVQWSVSEKDAIFGLQVGWGADRDAYAFDYGKSFSDKPIVSLGLILDKGTTPIVKLMNL